MTSHAGLRRFTNVEGRLGVLAILHTCSRPPNIESHYLRQRQSRGRQSFSSRSIATNLYFLKTVEVPEYLGVLP
jgi:uncharacterized lipoprotein YmbA